HRYWIAALLAAASFAQNPADLFEKAPPAVDEALHARVREFYQLHVDKKFRQAERLVADDTKDLFYAMEKPNYYSFEIRRIEYSDNFTKAKVLTVCEMTILVVGFADKPVKVPIPSRWKLVDGHWYWYVDQEELKETPFGVVNPGKERGAGSLPA